MVFALTGVITALVVTGLLVLGGEEKQGPLSAIIGYSVGTAAKHAHSWLTMLLLSLITAHVAGVVVESVLTHDNLVRAIVTGWKTLPSAAPVPTPRPARPVLAITLFLVLAGCGIGIVQWCSRLAPPHSLRVLAENATYQKECGACHYALNPSLLPGASWAGLMTGLREHFGEDASLDDTRTRSLAAWLVANSAETFDTESSNRFRQVAPDNPFRVTATPYWIRKHAGIAAEVFARKGVRGKVNCHACHRDARSGRYDDQAITIPEG
jgi:hypothetical protein